MSKESVAEVASVSIFQIGASVASPAKWVDYRAQSWCDQ